MLETKLNNDRMINGEHSKKESSARRFTSTFVNFFQPSGKEIICIVSLGILLTFFATVEPLSTEIDHSSKIITVHYGFPSESLMKIYTIQSGGRSFHGYVSPLWIIRGTVNIIWSGFVVNFVVYAILSWIIVRGITRVMEEIRFRRYK